MLTTNSQCERTMNRLEHFMCNTRIKHAITTFNMHMLIAESIWENIYSLSVEALDSNSLKMLKKFYYDLNTYHEKAKADGFPRKVSVMRSYT